MTNSFFLTEVFGYMSSFIYPDLAINAKFGIGDPFIT